MIRISEDFVKDGIPENLILRCIKEHKKDLGRLIRNKDYYTGNHKILNRIKEKGDPNNKLVNNYASYITDTVCGYFMGNPMTVSSLKNEDIDVLLEQLYKLDINTHNADLEKDLSIYGIAYELLYMNEESNLKIAILPPESTFVVYSNKIGDKSLFAVNYYEVRDIDLNLNGYDVYVYTENEVLRYYSRDFSEIEFKESALHYFERVPITQFFNNAESKGDFEGVITQIDAYNTLMSDRVNDKEKFVDGILVATGISFESYDDEDEDIVRKIKQNRIIEIPNDSDLKYVTKALNETEVQVLASAIKDDIHKFSHTPDFTDENFSGNVSGVAMNYKLLALDDLAKVKERFFITGIKRRLKLIHTIFNLKGIGTFDLEAIKLTMVRTRPVNNIELAQMINYLKGTVSNETLISQLPFVEDPVNEMEKLRNEEKEKDYNLLNSMSRASFNSIGG